MLLLMHRNKAHYELIRLYIPFIKHHHSPLNASTIVRSQKRNDLYERAHQSTKRLDLHLFDSIEKQNIVVRFFVLSVRKMSVWRTVNKHSFGRYAVLTAIVTFHLHVFFFGCRIETNTNTCIH